MNDENKQEMVDQKKGAEEKTQLSEDALSNVSGGVTPKQNVATVNESFSLTYSKVEYK